MCSSRLMRMSGAVFSSPPSPWGALPRDVWQLILALLSPSYPQVVRLRCLNRSFATAIASHLAVRSSIAGFRSERPFYTLKLVTYAIRDPYQLEVDADSFCFINNNPRLVRIVWREYVSSAFPPVDEVQHYSRDYDLATVVGRSIDAPYGDSSPTRVDQSGIEDPTTDPTDSRGNKLLMADYACSANLVDVKGSVLCQLKFRNRVRQARISAGGVVGLMYEEEGGDVLLKLY